MTEIPLLDLAPWFDGDDDARQALAAELDAHLQRLGFLVVVNHGIPAELMTALREQSLAFFHQPPEVKAQIAVGGGYRGWIGPGLESNAASYGIDTPPDLKETFAVGPVEIPDATLVDRYPRSYAPNRFPDAPAGLQPAAEAWWIAARDLCNVLLEICAAALRLPHQHLVEQCRNTTAQIALNWYGPRGDSEPEPNQFRIGPHTDFGTLTILDRQPGAGGLQVLDEDGEWIDAPHVPGSLIVNTGDLIRRWTNDRWCSNQHRVLPPPATHPDEELLSLVFFHEPDHDAWIEVLETCTSPDNPAKYPGIMAMDYLVQKMDALVVTS